MAYATTTDLTQVGISAEALADIAAGDQEAAIDAASAVVDSYLRSRFTLPLTEFGDDLTRATCVLAVYDLLVVRGYNPEAGAADQVRLRYEDVLRWLERVSAGSITPAVTDSSSTGAARAAPRAASNTARGW